MAEVVAEVYNPRFEFESNFNNADYSAIKRCTLKGETSHEDLVVCRRLYFNEKATVHVAFDETTSISVRFWETT
jgi:hypothetical protein